MLQILEAGISIVKQFRGRCSYTVVNIHASSRGLYVEVTTVRK